MEEVRRGNDRELCGVIQESNGSWAACTVFGAVLADGKTKSEATNYVLEHGLAVLSEPWILTTSSSKVDQVVRIIEASPSEVRLALGFYSVPGVPVITLSSTALENDFSLRPQH